MEKPELEAEISRQRDVIDVLTIERDTARDLAESLRSTNLILSADLIRTTSDIAGINARIARVLANVRGQ